MALRTLLFQEHIHFFNWSTPKLDPALPLPPTSSSSLICYNSLQKATCYLPFVSHIPLYFQPHACTVNNFFVMSGIVVRPSFSHSEVIRSRRSRHSRRSLFDLLRCPRGNNHLPRRLLLVSSFSSSGLIHEATWRRAFCFLFLLLTLVLVLLVDIGYVLCACAFTLLPEAASDSVSRDGWVFRKSWRLQKDDGISITSPDARALHPKTAI